MFDRFQQSSLADFGGGIFTIMPWRVFRKYQNAVGTQFSSSILDMGIKDGIFKSGNEGYGWYYDTLSHINFFLVPPSIMLTSGTGAAQVWRCPVFKKGAYKMTMKNRFSQSVPQLDKWFAPTTMAMGRQFGMTRMFDEIAFEFQINVQQNQIN
jgi:hypothetical protein